MDQHNIDRLFREKMDGLEAAPSPQSWSQVEKRLKTNRKPAYYWVAAAVTILAVSWVLIPTQTDLEGQFAHIEITHPPISVSKKFEIPVAITLSEKKKSQKVTLSQTVNSAPLASTKQVITVPNISKKDLPVVELENKTAVIADVSETPLLKELRVVPIEVEEKKELITSPVKITYIASNNASAISQADNRPDSTSKFKKFIAFAEKIDPGEMLADMKTAKDNLLNSGFKSKKDKSVMNP